MMNMIWMLLLFSPAPADSAVVDGDMPVRVEQVWIREAPPTAKVMAAYGTFCNDNDRDALVLTGATSESFRAVEMHVSRESGSQVSMQRLDEVSLAPGNCVTFEPGARHFMLFDPVRPFRSGDTIMLTLRFAGGAEQDIAVAVRRADETDSGPHHKHH